MLNKYLISVKIPAIEMEFDCYIPNNKKVGTIKKCVLEAITDLTNQMCHFNSDDVRLIDRDTGKEYSNNMFIKDSGIRNGSKLIIV